MRTLLAMTILLSYTPLYAAPVPEGGVPLSVNADGEFMLPVDLERRG